MIEQFLEHLQDEDKSPNTINGYKLELRLFSEWFNRTNEREAKPEIITARYKTISAIFRVSQV